MKAGALGVFRGQCAVEDGESAGAAEVSLQKLLTSTLFLLQFFSDPEQIAGPLTVPLDSSFFRKSEGCGAAKLDHWRCMSDAD